MVMNNTNKKLAQDSLDNFLAIVLKDSKGVLFFIIFYILPFQQNELADINKVHVNDCQKSHSTATTSE